MFENFDEFTPYDFIDFSKEIYDNLDDESNLNSAYQRVIYSRIYYGTFLYVREWLKKYWGYNSSTKDHTKMLNFIKTSGPFGFFLNSKIADDLKTLKILRHQADYYITVPEEGSIKYSQWIFESIDYAFELSHSIIEHVNEIEVP